MAEKVYSTSKLINLHSADGSTLLIPKVPLSTVDNNAYTVVDGAIVTKGAGVSLRAAVQAEIAAAVDGRFGDVDSNFGNYVPWTDGSNVEIPGTLRVTDSATFSGFTAVENDFAVTGYIEVGGSANILGEATLGATLAVTGKATLSDELEVAKAATLKGEVRVEGKLVAAQDMYIETTSNGETTSTKVATMADIDGITGGTLNNYYTKDEVDTIAEGVLEDANSYTDKQDSALREELLGAIGSSIDAIDHLKRQIVQDELPAVEDADLTTIYMVPSVIGEGEAARTVYVEYMVINGKWETIGDSDVQLVNYYTKAETDAAIEAAFNDFDGGFGDSGLKAYIDTQDDAHLGSANAYTDEAIAAALNSLKVDGKDLKSYIDAQDAATSTAAVTAANGYTDTASNALSAAIVAVDNKFADYYDKDGIAGLGYATITQVNTASAAAVAEANGYTDSAIAGINKDLEGYATIQYVDAQDAATSTAAVTAANGYTDQQLANYVTTETAGQYVKKEQLGGDEQITTIAKISSVSQDGIIALGAMNGVWADAYTTDAVDAKFAPLSGAALTEVASIAGESAVVTVAKIETTDIEIMNEVQLAGIILGRDPEGGAITHITEDMANFAVVDVASDLTVRRDLVVEGMLNIHPEGGQIEIGIDQTSAGMITIGAGNAIFIENQAGFIDFGSGIANIDLNESKVQVYDEWTDGQTTSTGLADVATEHDIAEVKAYTDAAIADALEAFKVDGKDLKTYIDEQDDAHQSAAEANAKAYTDSKFGEANSYTDTQVAAASSSIMNTINALPGVGEGAILYDIIEDEQI